MPAAVIIAEAPSGKIFFRNRRAQQIREQSLGQARATKLEDAGDFQIFHPDGRPYEIEEWPLMRTIRDGEKVSGEEFVYPLADGSRLWLRCNSSPIYDDKGHIVAGVLLAHDMTEQKRSEEERAHHAYLLENTEDAILASDEQVVLTAWNKGAEKMFGWTAEEVLGRKVYEILPYTDYSDEQLEEALRKVAKAGRRRTEATWHRKDGAPVYAEALTIALRAEEGGKITGYLSIVRDMTQRRRAEEEIETRVRQQTAVDEVVACVARTFEVEYAKIVELLPGGEELLLRSGVGFEEGLVGRAREGAGLGSQAGYTLLSEEPVIAEDFGAEGRFRPPPLVHERGAASGVSVVIASRDGPFGVLGAFTTSYRSFSEDDANFMQAVANVLATAIEREETEEWVEEVREAERSRISRDLHDELLQELTDALVQTQQIQSSSKDPQQTLRLERLLATLDRIGLQLRGAIYDLKLDAEHAKHFPELLEALVELHREMAPESEIALEVHNGVLSGPLGERGRQLLRILGEALTNIRRHSGASQVRVGVGITEGKLWAEVKDDGRGFDAAAYSEEALSSSGVGIRGMRERARALGGDLEIESDPHSGTRVRFEMLLKKDDEDSEDEVGVRVLLVEDHAAIREALASSLEGEGFEVVGQAGSMADARRMLEEHPIDVALIDLGLPDGYGAELIKELREAHPQAQALVLSASLDRTNVARAVERGAAGVLSKTAHLEEVVQAVRRLRAGQTLMPLEEVVELLRYSSTRREEEHEAHQAIEKLTPREIEVLEALAEGLDNERIAEKLNIALRTERNHMASILKKLDSHSQLQALVFALRHGVVEIS